MRHALITPAAYVLAALALAAGGGTAADAQAGVEDAIAAGAVGEQADGYLGFPRAPSAELRAEVDAINIKRREGYTQVAQSRNVPIEVFAASIGCKTLVGLRTGRAYSIGGALHRPGAIRLPQQCGE